MATAQTQKANVAQVAATAADRPQQSPQSTTVTDNEIARRAYDRFLARGCEHGHDVEDWLQAERELGAPASAVSA